MESGPIPPVWTWFPVTALAAAFAVSMHVDAVAGRHDRSGVARLALGAGGGLIVVAPFVLALLGGPGGCYDNEWLSNSVGTSSTTEWGALRCGSAP